MQSSELVRSSDSLVVGRCCLKCGRVYTTNQWPAASAPHDFVTMAETCCIERKCECGKEMPKYYKKCSSCQSFARWVKFGEKPEAVWDGKFPVVLFDDDRYFFDDESLYEWIEAHHPELEEGDLEIEACHVSANRTFSIVEHVEWDEDACQSSLDEPEIDNYVNDWIKNNVPPRYEGNGERITNQVLKAIGIEYKKEVANENS